MRIDTRMTEVPPGSIHRTKITNRTDKDPKLAFDLSTRRQDDRLALNGAARFPEKHDTVPAQQRHRYRTPTLFPPKHFQVLTTHLKTSMPNASTLFSVKNTPKCAHDTHATSDSTKPFQG